MNENQNVCKCPHHKIVPIVVILIAVDILLATWGAYSWMVANTIWPILVIIAATTKLGGCKCCSGKM